MAAIRRNNKRGLQPGGHGPDLVEPLPSSGPSGELSRFWSVLAKAREDVRELVSCGELPAPRETLPVRQTATEVRLRQEAAKAKIAEAEHNMGKLTLWCRGQEIQLGGMFPRLKFKLAIGFNPSRNSVFVYCRVWVWETNEPVTDAEFDKDTFPPIEEMAKWGLVG